MSDSRLEKFIYAICSMDVSDLPVPLSRIEKLWNCLITGEIPDFEPLSRNEKYLMAMLDRYDISNLPAPISRGEKLLYKIAVGETNLSDVPGYLSRYEELLKYLIENGGISGGDFEYVLYTLNQSLSTLYNTAEKPVKSAILKGQTLVNLFSSSNKAESQNIVTLDGGFVFKTHNSEAKFGIASSLFKPNTTYLIIFESDNNFSLQIGYDLFAQKGWINNQIVNGVNTLKLTTVNEKLYHSDLLFRCASIPNDITITNIRIIEYQEGMENWDIPYFTGMQSVKLPVLFTHSNGNLLHVETLIEGGYWSANDTVKSHSNSLYSKEYLFVKYYEKIKINKGNVQVLEYDENKNFIKRVQVSATGVYTINKGVCFIRISIFNLGLAKTVMVSVGDSIVPFTDVVIKTNILTAPNDVVLRGVGDVKDTLDLMTGEVVERVGEVVLDEDITGYQDTNYSTNEYSAFRITSITNIPNGLRNVICDKVKYYPNFNLDWYKQEEFFTSNGKLLFIKILSTKASNFEELRTFLSSSPITIQYQLKTELVKTVDLTTVDQDGQPTKLKTFNDITHVEIKADNLIPEVEMEVATNLLEDTVFNLTDAFNTLYPTAAKPVVDGTLYGQTIKRYKDNLFDGLIESGGLSINTGENDDRYPSRGRSINFIKVEPNSTITFSRNSGTASLHAVGYNSNKEFVKGFIDVMTGNYTLGKINTTSDIYYIKFYDIEPTSESEYGVFQGDVEPTRELVSVQAPSVTMTGKNLFDKTKVKYNTTVKSANGIEEHNPLYMASDFIKVEPNTNYISSHMGVVIYYDKNRNFLACFDTQTLPRNFTTPNNCKYIRIRCWEQYDTIEKQKEIVELEQLEKGNTITPYEPYKFITLSTPSDLELRKAGEVQDELNVMTGEVVERIDKIVLDGSEHWADSSYKTTNYFCAYTKLLKSENKLSLNVICDSFPSKNILSNTADYEGCIINNINNSSKPYEGNFVLKINKNKLSSEDTKGLKAYLKSNPLTVQYQLATPTTKIVDLTIVNQDGNETKLRTFDDITHVLLQSEVGPNPGASLTVRTKIPSGSSTSLLMDDISTEQEQLETTVDEQSNNVDATMIATTEIYEETL